MGSNYHPATKEDTYRLIEAAQSGNEAAREQLVEQNTGLVKNIALKYTNSGYEFDDLLQIGFIGLLKAVDRFDTNYDVMFSTYAVPMIMGEIKRHLRDDGRVKISRQIKQDVRIMKQVCDKFCHVNGRPPKVSELAEEMGINTDDLLLIMEAGDAMSFPESLNDPNRPEIVPECDYRESEEKRIDTIYLKSAVGKLEERERQIIVLRYFKDMTQQQIAEKLGISQVQVSRIEKRVLLSLREQME
jgi:RNA polymerase sporulation-specific sigma factor